MKNRQRILGFTILIQLALAGCANTGTGVVYTQWENPAVSFKDAGTMLRKCEYEAEKSAIEADVAYGTYGVYSEENYWKHCRYYGTCDDLDREDVDTRAKREAKRIAERSDYEYQRRLRKVSMRNACLRHAGFVNHGKFYQPSNLDVRLGMQQPAQQPKPNVFLCPETGLGTCL